MNTVVHLFYSLTFSFFAVRSRAFGNSQFDKASLSLFSLGNMENSEALVCISKGKAELEKGLHRNTGWEEHCVPFFFATSTIWAPICNRENGLHYATGHFLFWFGIQLTSLHSFEYGTFSHPKIAFQELSNLPSAWNTVACTVKYILVSE